MKKLFSIFLMTLLFASGLNADQIHEDDKKFKEAVRYKSKKEYAKAFTLFLDLAKKGYGRPQYYLSLAYKLGQGVEQNDAQALYWLKSAAKLGNIRAITLLAETYYNGWGIAVDKKAARSLLEKVKDSGDKKALYLWKKYHFDAQ